VLLLKNSSVIQVWWFILEILATQEVEIRRTVVQGLPSRKLVGPISANKKLGAIGAHLSPHLHGEAEICTVVHAGLGIK
jgi:hypothetical protein